MDIRDEVIKPLTEQINVIKEKYLFNNLKTSLFIKVFVILIMLFTTGIEYFINPRPLSLLTIFISFDFVLYNE